MVYAPRISAQSPPRNHSIDHGERWWTGARTGYRTSRDRRTAAGGGEGRVALSRVSGLQTTKPTHTHRISAETSGDTEQVAMAMNRSTR